jgi:DNA-binding CsgD family transcriptional regulator
MRRSAAASVFFSKRMEETTHEVIHDELGALLRLIDECRDLFDAGTSPALHLRRGLYRVLGADAARETALLELLRGVCPWLFECDEVGRARLSPRERDTLRVLLTGTPEKQLADHLGVSAHTAHGYVKTLYKKLGVRSRVELMARAGRRGA